MSVIEVLVVATLLYWKFGFNKWEHKKWRDKSKTSISGDVNVLMWFSSVTSHSAKSLITAFPVLQTVQSPKSPTMTSNDPNYLCLIFHFSQSCKLAMKNSLWHFTVTSQTRAVNNGPLGVSQCQKSTQHSTMSWIQLTTGFSIIHRLTEEINSAWLVVIDQTHHWLFRYIHYTRIRFSYTKPTSAGVCNHDTHH